MRHWYLSPHWLYIRADWFAVDVIELATYLGRGFDPSLLHGKDSMISRAALRYDTPMEFYKNSSAYLYHLTTFASDVWKQPYYATVRAVMPPTRVLDYGCGIGADGLNLSRWGYTPSFADFSTKCTEYLRWRLDRRGIRADVYDVETDAIPKHPLVVCFDVLEHIEPDAQADFLRNLARLGRVAIVNLIGGNGDDDNNSDIHYPVDVTELAQMIVNEYAVYAAVRINENMILAYGENLPAENVTMPAANWSETEEGELEIKRVIL